MVQARHGVRTEALAVADDEEAVNLPAALVACEVYETRTSYGEDLTIVLDILGSERVRWSALEEGEPDEASG